ncbi:MAG TPA: PAS domain S-box protein [Chryseosolibacter sp.]
MFYRAGILDKNVSERDILQRLLQKIYEETLGEHFSLPDEIIARHSDSPFHVVFIYDELAWVSLVSATLKEVPVIAILKKGAPFKEALEAGAKDFLYEGFDEFHLQKSVQLAIERKNSELNYEALFFEAPTPMLLLDPESQQIELANKAALQHYGYSESEFVQLKVTDIEPYDLNDNLIQKTEPKKTLLSSYEGERLHRKKNGEIIAVEVRGSFVKRKRRVLHVVAIQDVTEKKKNFQLIKDQKEQLKLHIVGSRMFSVDINYKTGEVKMSDEARQILGPKVKSDLTIEDLVKIIHPEDRARMVDLLNNFSPAKITKTQFRVFRPDGSVLWLERRPYLYYDEAQNPLGTKGLIFDITEQKQIELELTKSFAELQRAATQQASILNTLPAHIALLNKDGIIIAVNERWKDFGDENSLVTPDHGLGMSYFAGVQSNPEIQYVHDKLRAVLRGELDGFQHEYTCHAPFKQRWFTMITSKLENEGGAVVMHVDITDRKLAEIEFLKSQANLAAIFNTTEDAFVLIGTDYKIMTFNKQAATNASRYFNQEYKHGASFLDYVQENFRESFTKNLEEAQKGDGIYFETSFKISSEEHWYKIRVQAVRDADHRTIGYCISGHNFTEQKTVELKLRASEERFRSLIENSGELFTICDYNGVITYTSPNIKNILGDIPMAANRIQDLIHPEELAAYTLLFKRVQETPSRIFHYIHRIKGSEEEWQWIEGSIVNLHHLEAVRGIVTNFRNITARVKVELELKKNQYFLDKAASAAKLGYWVFNLTDLSVRWSTQMFEIFGGSEKLTRPSLEYFYSTIYPEDLEFVQNTVERLMHSQKPESFVCRTLNPNGKIRWVNIDAEFSYDDAGNALSMLGIAQDITDLKEKEEHLRVSKNNLDSLINSSQDLIWAVDATGKLMAANRTYQHIVFSKTGNDPKIGADAIMNESPNLSFWRENYASALRGEFMNFEYSFLHSDRLYDIRLNPIFDGARIIGVSAYGRDITEEKKSADVIRKIYSQYEILSRATNDAVWDWDIRTNSLTWNHGLQLLFGHPQDTQTKQLTWWEENIHAEDRTDILRSFQLVIEKKNTHWTGNYRFRCADGTYKYVFDRAYTVYEDGVPTRMIGAMQDIDELTHYRKSLEQKVAERTRELHQSLAKEKELAEMKNRFVSIASHEFRTPLATIEFATGFLRSYRNKISDDEVGQKLATIERQVNHMASLLEDVLAVEKTQVGKIQVVRNAIDLEDVLKDVCESVERLTKYSHQIRFTYDLALVEYYTDEKLLRNIFSNLLTNAIKFSPGTNEVVLTCREAGEHLIFTITDKGIGINSADLENIFEPFTRGSNAGTIPGTGLGLSIVKRTVDLLGGDIAVTSRPGDTKFKISLPKNTNGEN